jgi:signal transduction histidine kinase
MVFGRRTWQWILGASTLVLAGGWVLVRWDIAERREAFHVDARAAHRLLSQRAAQQEAVLATLVLLSPTEGARERPEQRLPALYPQLLRVLRADAGHPWRDPLFQQAEARSLERRRAEVAMVDPATGRYTLLQAGTPASFALVIDAQQLAPWGDWPIARGGAVSVRLVLGAKTLVLQPGADAGTRPAGLTDGFVFQKVLALDGQPFELQLQQATGPAMWPWRSLALWVAAVSLTAALLAAWQRARGARRRAEELLRLSQVARLNALGEMAAGIAHELNQPLAAMSANAQAARRLLDDDPPELDEARRALVAASAQAKRAAEVVARLRQRVEAPAQAGTAVPVSLHASAAQVLELLQPELRGRGVAVELSGTGGPVRADPVALQQILHNLVNNALMAMDDVPAGERRLSLHVDHAGGQGRLTVRDSGSGIASELLPRLFEPFFTTRSSGLGLGLSLCQTLAQAMHGTLRVSQAPPRGAEFTLALPLAHADAESAS